MANIENSRNSLRRIMNDDQEFSNQSIINVIEKFVKSVNIMEETILVPSRLLDRQVGDSSDAVAAEKSHHHHHHHHHNKKKSSNIRDHLANTDLFNLYSMLNSVKVDLLWGRNGQQDGGCDEMPEIILREQNYDSITTVVESVATTISTDTANNNINTNSDSTKSEESSAATNQKGHARRPSTVSVSSSNSSSSTISDSESEVSSNENDSGIESENQQEKDRTAAVANQFRAHLLGLYQSLEQMTEAASYLTARYQSDMGGIN